MPCQSATTAGPNHPYAPAGDHSECTHQRFLPAALRCIFTRCMSPRVHEPLPKATEDPTANRGTSLGNRQKSDQQASWASAACGKCPVSSVRSDPVLVVSCVVSGRVRPHDSQSSEPSPVCNLSATFSGSLLVSVRVPVMFGPVAPSPVLSGAVLACRSRGSPPAGSSRAVRCVVVYHSYPAEHWYS